MGGPCPLHNFYLYGYTCMISEPESFLLSFCEFVKIKRKFAHLSPLSLLSVPPPTQHCSCATAMCNFMVSFQCSVISVGQRHTHFISMNFAFLLLFLSVESWGEALLRLQVYSVIIIAHILSVSPTASLSLLQE